MWFVVFMGNNPKKNFILFFSQNKKIKDMMNSTNTTALTLLIVSVVGVLLCSKLAGDKLIEGFLMYPQTYVVDSLNAQGTASLSGNNQQQLFLNRTNAPVFTVPGQYQSPLTPRFSNTGYGAYITYNLPEKKNLAVDPTNPMMLASMVEKPKLKEQFNYPPNSSSTDYQQKYDSLTKPYQAPDQKEIITELPVQSMGVSNGSEVPLVMDRFIVSNLKSYRYGSGDFIRGDLPIAPILPQSDPYSAVMFRPSTAPSIDLNPGAMAVLGGAYNENVRDTVQLQLQSNAGLRNTFAGVGWERNSDTVLGNVEMNMNMNRSNNLAATQGSPYGDVSVTQFP